MTRLRFEDHAQGRVFHAAQVALTGRPSGPGGAAGAGGADTGDRPGLHGHDDYYELMGIVDGQGEQWLGNGRQALESGDVVLVRPSDRHEPLGRMTFVNVAFPAEAWRAFLDLGGLDPAIWETPAEPPRFSLHGGAVGAMRGAFERALTSFHRTPTRLDLLRFWTDVLDAIGDQQPGRSEPPRPEWLDRACTAMRIEQHLRGGVPALLRLSHVSPAHLSRSMRAYYGITPTEFVTELRVAHAAGLLATTLLSVTEIAHRSGFSSQSYFTRCFRRARGLSPRAFRQRAVRAFVP